MSVSCVAPTRRIRAICASSSIIPFFFRCEIQCRGKADYPITIIGVHFQPSRGLAPWRFSPSNQEVRPYSIMWHRLFELRYFRFVEETYQLEMGNAQNTQLSKAITVGSEKGVFYLPKGFEFCCSLVPSSQYHCRTIRTCETCPESQSQR